MREFFPLGWRLATVCGSVVRSCRVELCGIAVAVVIVNSCCAPTCRIAYIACAARLERVNFAVNFWCANAEVLFGREERIPFLGGTANVGGALVFNLVVELCRIAVPIEVGEDGAAPARRVAIVRFVASVALE